MASRAGFFLCLVVCALGAGASVARADGSPQPTTIADGIQIGSVAVGGVPPGPGNPLGTRWMGLSAPGVGIHGTDEPWSIGRSESHGCIRMQVPAAAWLFNQVRVGTPVFIVSS